MYTYECLCTTTVSGVPEFQQSKRKCQQIHQHAEVAFNFTLLTTVTVLFIYRKLNPPLAIVLMRAWQGSFATIDIEIFKKTYF